VVLLSPPSRLWLSCSLGDGCEFPVRDLIPGATSISTAATRTTSNGYHVQVENGYNTAPTPIHMGTSPPAFSSSFSFVKLKLKGKILKEEFELVCLQ